MYVLLHTVDVSMLLEEASSRPLALSDDVVAVLRETMCLNIIRAL